MTRRSRQLLVAGGLVILFVWAVLAWFGPSGAPEPSSGPLPTGGIDSGPLTFRPTEGVASSPTAGGSVPE
jgi:hypothetical protein